MYAHVFTVHGSFAIEHILTLLVHQLGQAQGQELVVAGAVLLHGICPTYLPGFLLDIEANLRAQF